MLESCWCACAKNKMLPSYLRSSQMNSAHACGRRNERCVRPRTKLTGTFFSSGTFFYSSFGIYFAPSGIFELGRAERAGKKRQCHHTTLLLHDNMQTLFHVTLKRYFPEPWHKRRQPSTVRMKTNDWRYMSKSW